MKFFQVAFSAIVTAATALAWDATQRDCSNYEICLTSFIWCSTSNEGCSYPSGAYPRRSDENTGYPLLLSNYNYTITWKKQQANDSPVRIRWHMQDLRDGWLNATWEANTTDSSYRFNPQEILNSFPTAMAPNVTVAEAWYRASFFAGSVLSIAQPDLADKDGNFPTDTSRQFYVLNGNTEAYFTAQNEIGHRDEYNKWKLSVGISVGLGVPILMALTAFGTWVFMKKRFGTQGLPVTKR